ncbi:FMN-dependent alpha-hydroxy acid dehydrogenase [Piedraia hortae CBS 480.64]|uniref:FMN-dependent alpha-hydroxy acid dehydrogenase n=1 Tax=Piedraia hortae CBS 480.64 TaxID=1314780 RepID=A0A6A7C184_9PEZI|nr:FMN-dependent alpha-hydroxy acid dehydrogenase [Piedraia hortae CBS 480.64]
MTPKARNYYSSASDDMFSKSLNSTIYRQILLRPRILVDCTRVSTRTTFLGHEVSLPFFAAPAAMARLGHRDGEAGIAAACAKFGVMQIVSNNSSMGIEEVVGRTTLPPQPPQPTPPTPPLFGWQLYIQKERPKSEEMLRRVGKLPQVGFICLTVDAPVPGKREDDQRTAFTAGEESSSPSPSSGGEEGKATPSPQNGDAKGIEGGAIHPPSQTDGNPNPQSAEKRKEIHLEESPPIAGGVGKALSAGMDTSLTWSTALPWLAKLTHLPIVIKGIQTHEDAYIAYQHYPLVRGIILSNHGGRALDTAPPPIHTLLEIRKFCPEVLEKLEVCVDGGIKRGTDVVKALALGAKLVGLGRAPLYGNAAGGEKGVERVWEILKDEVETAMRLLGVERVDQLGKRHVNTRAVERDLFDGRSKL